MIELYTWTTPNGLKPLIMLEELGVPYHVKAINIGKGEQNAPEYLRINPNAKIPALVDDRDGETLTIFESAAILIHLAEKSGQFLPKSGQARVDTLAWLSFQIGGIGPMFGQLGHFRGAKREDPYPVERYTTETLRIAKVVDTRLASVPFLAGEYSIADIASFGWLSALPRLDIDVAKFPNLAKWLDVVRARPAVERAQAWKPA